MTSGLRITLISLLLSAPVAAQLFPEQEILFEHRFPGRNQLENSITCFLQDRQGFLWIGTKRGLFKYDSYTFHSYKMDPGSDDGLSDDYIRCLHEHSSEEVILIGTDRGGMNILDKTTGEITRFLYDEDDSTSIGCNIVYDIEEDEKGRIWVATLGGGLNSFSYDAGYFQKHLLDEQHPDSAANKYVKCLYFDKTQGLLVGTRFSGMYRFDLDSLTCLPVTDRHQKVRLKELWCITGDQEGNLWVGTQHQGIFRITHDADNRYTYKEYNSSQGFLSMCVISIYCDRDGVLWAGAWAGGLYRYNANDDKFTRFKHSNENLLSLSGDHVLAVFEDNAGTLWIGTHAKGINLIQTGRWKFYPHRFTTKHNYGQPQNEVRSILNPAGSSTLWAGTSQGLMEFNMRTGADTRYGAETDTKEGILHNAVNSICLGENPDILWLGTPVGITRMNTKQKRFRHYPSHMMDSTAPLNVNIYKIHRDSGNILWIGTSRIGLVRFDPQTNEFSAFYDSSSEPGSIMPWLVRDIIQWNPDTLCLATSRGIYCFNTRILQFSSFGQNHPLHTLTDKNVTVLHRDARGNLWIGTDDYGLIHFDCDDQVITQFTEKHGLGSNNVRGIVEADGGVLFISTVNGISSYDVSTDQFSNFYLEDGLHDTEFWDRAIAKCTDGKMFFGGIGGFTSLDPTNIQNNQFIPPVHITDFSVLQYPFPLDKDIVFTKHIELNYRMKSFSIGFVALNFINPQDNHYQYQLEGVDREWQSSENNRDVTYRNINPGRYTFRVKGSNNDGFWNEEGDTLSIYIKPPLWQTSLFRIVCCSLILAIIYIIIRRRFKQLRRESFMRRLYTHSLIRNQELERKRIASELHDSLGQDLLIIKNRIKMIQKRAMKQGKDVSQLQQICTIADDTISHIRQISFNLHPYLLEKIGLTDALKSMINKVNEVSDLTFSCHIEPVDGLLDKEQEINFYRILQELINNIIKHSQAKSAEIDICRDRDSIQLRLEDDGIGFDYDKASTDTDGFGLSGVKERIEILKGEFNIRTAAGFGTRYNINIKIPKD
jgi:signal transduction histidine kinase/ligand-binding sensor domain-containing protein